MGETNGNKTKKKRWRLCGPVWTLLGGTARNAGGDGSSETKYIIGKEALGKQKNKQHNERVKLIKTKIIRTKRREAPDKEEEPPDKEEEPQLKKQ